MGQKGSSPSQLFFSCRADAVVEWNHCADDFISFYSPTLCGGGTSEIEFSELPISVSLFWLYPSPAVSVVNALNAVWKDQNSLVSISSILKISISTFCILRAFVSYSFSNNWYWSAMVIWAFSSWLSLELMRHLSLVSIKRFPYFKASSIWWVIATVRASCFWLICRQVMSAWLVLDPRRQYVKSRSKKFWTQIVAISRLKPRRCPWYEKLNGCICYDFPAIANLARTIWNSSL